MYLDHNAGGRIRAEVAEGVSAYLGGEAANPSSSHAAGRLARQALDEARDEVAGLIGARPAEIVFTSSGTEANGLALLGAAAKGERVVTTPIEHVSVLRAGEAAGDHGSPLEFLEVDQHGLVDVEAAVARARGAGLLSVGWVNGEIGTLQPIARMARALDALDPSERPLFHSDAVQAAGSEEIDVERCSVDLLSLSGHKIGAPAGIGALFVRSGVSLRPQIHGGPQERERRAGTENVLGIVGFGIAARLARTGREARRERLRGLRERLWSGIADACGPIVRVGSKEGGAGTLAVAIVGLRGDALVVALDRAGVAASTGSACAAGAPEPSHVLRALGYDDDLARSVVRFSIGNEIDEEAIDLAIGEIVEVVRYARSGQEGIRVA